MGHWKAIGLHASAKPQLSPFAPAVGKWKGVRGEPLSKACALLWAKGRTHFSLLQGLRSSPEPCRTWVRTPLPAASACLFAGDELLPFAVSVGTLLGVPPRTEGALCLQATHQQSCRQSVGRRKISYKKKERSIRRHLPPNAHSRLAPLPRADVPQACTRRGGKAGTHRSGRSG